MRSGATIAALATVIASAGCTDDALMPPAATGGAIFDRYVAFGNSITAGFQSGGINDSTQNQSYAALLAAQMGTDFTIPSLNYPGCPPPLVNIFTQQVVPGGAGVPCALRSGDPPPVINNVAVPGAQVLDVLSNIAPGNSANALTNFILGGKTQYEMARRVMPTFATVWIGNNDALGAATAGDATLLTPPTTFDAQYRAMMDSLVSMGIQGGVLIGVAKVTSAPFLTPGVSFFGAWATAQLPPTFTVAANCAPASLGGVGETTLVPFTYGFGVLMSQALAGTAVTLNCATDAPVLTTPELGQVVANVTAYNATIQAVATENDWAYFDPNTVLDSLLAAGDIPPFPNATGPAAITTPFGAMLSRDGIHPSAIAHRLLTNSIIDVINAKYSTNLAHIAVP